MTEKKKARRDAATSKRAKVETSRAGRDPHTDFTTGKAFISSFLLSGRENAIPRRELEKLTDLDGRTVRLMIEQERRAGIPVLSDNASGYFLPATDEERAACVRSLRHRAAEILKTAQAIERDVSEVEGQVSLDV